MIAKSRSILLVSTVLLLASNVYPSNVGIRPFPRSDSEHGIDLIGSIVPSKEEISNYNAQSGNYPFCAQHTDALMDYDSGDFVTKKAFFEHYLPFDQPWIDPNPGTNPLIRKIRGRENAGQMVEHIIICREGYLYGNDSHPGPFHHQGEPRILFQKDVNDLRKLFQDAYNQGRVKNSNYKLIQLLHEPALFIDVHNHTHGYARDIIATMDGIAYESHQYNVHWPYEHGKTRPRDLVRGAEWALNRNFDYIFYYGPYRWDGINHIEREFLVKFWAEGLPKHHPRMHYYLNSFPYLDGRFRPVGPESDPHTHLGFLKWLIEEVKFPPTTLTRYIQINGGEWLQQGSATLCAGGTVSFGPHPIEQNWRWTGPNGFSSNSRAVTLSNITPAQAGNYVATYTANGSSNSVTYSVNVHALPQATVSATRETCERSNGVITLSFPDRPDRKSIRFSIDGGRTYPISVNDSTGSYRFTGLAPGVYDVWAQWGNGDCPVRLGIRTIHADPLPRASVGIKNPSGTQNNGAITLTFPDTDRRHNISFSINGGTNYTTVSDNSGSYTFSNLAPGDYAVWSRWGNGQCPIKLGDYRLIRGTSDSSGDTVTSPGTDPGVGPVANGTYRLKGRQNARVLDVAAFGTANGSNLHLWDWHGGSNQRWNVTHLGGGQYSIIGVGSGKGIDVSAVSTADGANIQIWTYLGNDNQKWIVSPTNSGYHRLTAVHSGKVLDVSGSANGSNIHQWTWHGGLNQQWALQTP